LNIPTPALSSKDNQRLKRYPKVKLNSPKSESALMPLPGDTLNVLLKPESSYTSKLKLIPITFALAFAQIDKNISSMK